MTILLVDDSATMPMSLKATLALNGLQDVLAWSPVFTRLS